MDIYSETDFKDKFDDKIIEQVKKVKLIIADVDGVLTDGNIYKGGDNAINNIELKKKIESKYKNISVHLKENNGVSSSINFAAKHVKTKYFLQISPDVIFNFKDLNIFLDYAAKFNYKFAEPKNQVIKIISSELKKDSQGNLAISGMLENQGEITANMINVIATLYDRDGDVVTVSSVKMQPDFLRSGDSNFFIIPIYEKYQLIHAVDYTLIAESDEYTVVPEFPLGSGVLLIASVSSYIILSRNPEKVVNSISKISKIISF